jgi:hypothetical protein
MNFVKRYFRGKFNEIREWQDPQREETPMACPEVTIEGIDSDLYGKLLAEANAAGAIFVGEKVYFEGLEFNWTHDAESQVVHFTCTKKPFFIGCDRIENQIRQLAAKAKGAV